MFTSVVDSILQTNNERDITNTTTTLLYELANEFENNDNANGVLIPETFMFAKKFIFLTNFISKNVSEIFIDEDYLRGECFINNLIMLLTCTENM